MWLSFNKIEDIPLNSMQYNPNKISYLSWSIGLMMFVSMLCLSIYLQVTNTIGKWENKLNDGFCIELSESLEDLESENNKNLSELKKILKLLKTKNYVQSSNVIYRNNLTDFIGIFLGLSENDIDENLPAIIDIKVKYQLNMHDHDKLISELNDISPGLEIKSRRFWQNDLLITANSIRLAFAFLAFASVIIMMLITFFTTNIQMMANRKSVEILNLLGASSNYVAGQFSGNIFKRVIRCGVTVSTLIIALAFWNFDTVFHNFLYLISCYIALILITALLMSWVAFLVIRRSFYMFDINDNS